VCLVLMITNAWAEEPKTSQMDMVSGHDHHGMDHSKMMPHDSSANDQTREQVSPILKPEHGIQQLKANRDPHAYTDGHDFSDLSKPLMGDSHYLGAFIVDRLESVNARDDFSMTYDWQAWYGQDYDKLVIRAEGEIDQGTFKSALGTRPDCVLGYATWRSCR
jgi:copper resistance protein B